MKINRVFNGLKRRISAKIMGNSAHVTKDDFDWNTYPSNYKTELMEIQNVHTLKLSPGDYIFSDRKLNIQHNILPLHPNHRLLYETVLQLQPQSAMEIGCGGGDHLYNLKILAPHLELYGRELSGDQLVFLRQRSPDLKADVQQWDITLPPSRLLPETDLCYTQAVIMHLKTGNNHLVALANVFRIARKHVLLMENWTAHNFMADIQMLYDQQMIDWTNLHFYFRYSPEFNRPHLMVISDDQLDYEPLEDYEILRTSL